MAAIFSSVSHCRWKPIQLRRLEVKHWWTAPSCGCFLWNFMQIVTSDVTAFQYTSHFIVHITSTVQRDHISRISFSLIYRYCLLYIEPFKPLKREMQFFNGTPYSFNLIICMDIQISNETWKYIMKLEYTEWILNILNETWTYRMQVEYCDGCT